MSLAIIFDLDGTLWDSTGCILDIWNSVIDRHDEVPYRITKEQTEQCMGKTMEEVGELLFPELPLEARAALIDEMGNEEVVYLREHGAILYEGLEEVLKELSQEHPLFVVSNCQDGYVEAFMHAHKLESYFTDIEMSGRTGMAKGHNIKLLLERNHISSAVYVGDTAGDEKATRFAGLPFIYAKYGFGEVVAPDAVIESIRELPECIKNFQ
jgi:phosphoglycolate phosphatase